MIIVFDDLAWLGRVIEDSGIFILDDNESSDSHAGLTMHNRWLEELLLA